MWKNEYYLLLTVSAVWFQHPVLAELDPHRESQVSEKGPHSDCIKVFEDFSENPLDHGWSVFGDSQLFRWNQQLQLMEVTWDSSKPNSYLQFPLKTIMTRNDDFTIELDLTLLEIIGGIDPDKPSPMQVAFGFQNRADACSISFNRGTGQDSPNLVEFNYFPDTGYGPTIWPAVFSETSIMNFNGNEDFRIFELPLNETLHIKLSYGPDSHRVTISMTLDGIDFGPVTTAKVSTKPSPFGGTFTEFYLDAFAISSFSDQDLDPGPFSSSVLAQGFIDNITLSFPSAPIQQERHSIDHERWNHDFLSRENWNYALQYTHDFQTWQNVGDQVRGTGSILSIQDPDAPFSKSRFYRINAFPFPYDE